MKQYSLFLFLILLFSCASEEFVVPVDANFSYDVINDDFTVPVRIQIINRSTGADTWSWSIEGADPSSSASENPGVITFQEAGVYTIQLDASNQDGASDSYSQQIEIFDAVVPNFTAQIIESSYPPVEVELTNLSQGATSYNWTFENGIPSSSQDQHPANIVFETEGQHIIMLEVSNGLESYSVKDTIDVLPDIDAQFEYHVNPFDDDFQAPVTVTMENQSISATEYNWSFPGATVTSSTEENPSVTYTIPGVYTISLVAKNDKKEDSFEQQITILPDTNLRIIENIQLGINSSNSSIGSFYSSFFRTLYTEDQITEDNGSSIDLVFFGLNPNFTFNRFVSPDQASEWTFNPIPNATHTKFINSQELCNCGVNLSVADFDSMTNDSTLESITITETNGGLTQFDSSIIPRIVLFEAEDGRKGAIKVKSFVNDGDDAYIVVDIKVQKL